MKTLSLSNVFSLGTLFLLCFLFFAPQQVEAQHARAWVRANRPTTANYAPNLNFQFNENRGHIRVKRLGKGYYNVIFPRLGSSANGIFQATSHGGNHLTQVERWTRVGNDLHARVRVFTPSGAPKDAKFNLFFYKESRSSKINSGYVWVNRPSAPTHQYKFNSKGNINITKTGTGSYKIVFRGLAPNKFGEPAGRSFEGDRGNVQVTPYGQAPRKAQIINWSFSGSGLEVNVKTYQPNGTPADAQFNVSYISDFMIGQCKLGECPDYGAYLWANKPTTANYTPSMVYQNNNMTNTNNSIRRMSKGVYRILLPQLPSHKSIVAIASAYGSDKTHVSIQGTRPSPSGGTYVIVNTYNLRGQAADTRFTFFYYTNENILF